MILGCEAWLFQGCYLQRVLLSSDLRVANHRHAHARPHLTPCACRNDTPRRQIVWTLMHRLRPAPSSLRTSRFGFTRLVNGPLLVSRHCPYRSAANKSAHKEGLEAPSDDRAVTDAWESLPLLGNARPMDCCCFDRETRNPEQATQASCVSRWMHFTVLFLLLQVWTNL